MFNGVRIQLTLLYLAAALALILVMGGGAYMILRAYFQSTTDLALRHKMAHEFTLLGAPLPPSLADADRDWSILRADHGLDDSRGRRVESGDADSAIRADDDFHGALVEASGNPSIAMVLGQFEPVVRRAEFLRFVSIDRFAARERHDALIRLCAAGDAEAAARLAFDTWQSLPVAVPGQPPG